MVFCGSPCLVVLYRRDTGTRVGDYTVTAWLNDSHDTHPPRRHTPLYNPLFSRHYCVVPTTSVVIVEKQQQGGVELVACERETFSFQGLGKYRWEAVVDIATTTSSHLPRICLAYVWGERATPLGWLSPSWLVAGRGTTTKK